MPDSEAPTRSDSTRQLIERCNAGDITARARLARRCLPALRRWAQGRLALYGRNPAEIDDLVQIAVVRAFRNLDRFGSKHEGAFLADLRTIVLKLAQRDTRRDAVDRPMLAGTAAQDRFRTDLEDSAIPAAELEALESLVDQLPEPKRSAMILRIEMGMGYPFIAAELGLATPNTARAAVHRTLAELGRKLAHED